MVTEKKGDLIKLALKGEFDVIAHGCNCFCNMGAGIAPQMAKAFGADRFHLEGSSYKGDSNKLGNIDWEVKIVSNKGVFSPKSVPIQHGDTLFVVNAYTQYGFGKNHSNGSAKPLDYEALTLCMRKINHQFKGKRIGLPQIGCGLAGGDWNRVKQIIEKELKDCNVTIVIYEPTTAHRLLQSPPQQNVSRGYNNDLLKLHT